MQGAAAARRETYRCNRAAGNANTPAARLPERRRPAGAYRRIKDIPFAKNVYTAMCWGVLALLSAVGAEGVPRVASAAMFTFIAAKIFVAAVAADLKDLEADRARGVRTIVTQLGLRRAVGCVIWMNAAAALSTFALVLVGALPTFMLAAEVPSVVTAAVMMSPRLRAGDVGATAACAVMFELAHGTAWPLVELARAAMS